MNELTILTNPFQFIEKYVRTAVDDQDNIWFCAKDVCGVLEISWSSKTLENVPENWKLMIKLITSFGGKDTYFINEPGLYRLIFRSNKPKSIEFSNWVCEEVLPAIRKQGYFGVIAAKDRLAYSKQIVELTIQLASSKDAMLFKLLTQELRDLCN